MFQGKLKTILLCAIAGFTLACGAQEKVFECLKTATADKSLKIGDVVTLNAYHLGVQARHQRIVAAADDGSGEKCVNGFLNILSDGAVNARWFGAVGDGKQDDIASLQRACAYPHASRIILGNSEVYSISKTLFIEPEKIYVGNNVTLFASFDSGYIIEPRENSGRPTFNVIGNRLVLRGKSLDQTKLSGMRVGSSAFSRFEGIVVTMLGGHSIVFAATGQRDIISFTVDRLETNTGQGMKFVTGTVDSVNYKNITDGTVSNSFISCVGPGAVCVDMDCRSFAKPGKSHSIVGSMFGITFDRCSFNSCHVQGGAFIKMIAADPKSIIYSMSFNNCEGEFRLPRSVMKPPYPGIYLEGVQRSRFDVQGQLGRSDGIHLVRSDNNQFDFIADSILSPESKAFFIKIDKFSRGNLFNCVSSFMEALNTDEKYTTAPHSTFFLNHFQDDGTFNVFSGTISSSVIRHLKLENFSLINSKGEFLDPLLANNNKQNFKAAYRRLPQQILSVALPPGKGSGFSFKIPDSIGKDEVFCVNLEYRMTGDLNLLNKDFRLCINSRNVPLKKSSEWTRQAFFTRRNGDFGVFNYSGSLPGNLKLEFRKLELVTGGIPYIKEVRYSDIENPFYNLPVVSSENLPVDGGSRGELVVFNKTTGKFVYFNGRQWSDK